MIKKVALFLALVLGGCGKPPLPQDVGMLIGENLRVRDSLDLWRGRAISANNSAGESWSELWRIDSLRGIQAATIDSLERRIEELAGDSSIEHGFVRADVWDAGRVPDSSKCRWLRVSLPESDIGRPIITEYVVQSGKVKSMSWLSYSLSGKFSIASDSIWHCGSDGTFKYCPLGE